MSSSVLFPILVCPAVIWAFVGLILFGIVAKAFGFFKLPEKSSMDIE